MDIAAANIVQDSLDQAQVSGVVSHVLGAIKDAATSMPGITETQASVLRNTAGILCVGGVVVIVGMVTGARYSLRISKNEGLTLAPCSNEAV